MKRTLPILTLVVLLLLPVAALALEVVEGVITSGIQDRQPLDRLSNVPASAGTVYCFIRVTGAGEETTVTHVWFKGEQEMARIELPVRSSSWRTWSSKQLIPGWSGNWRVTILDSAGNELAAIPFDVE